jgi:hypothetical protein
MKKISLVLAVLVFLAVMGFAQNENLFKIERNKNANVVMYDAVIGQDGVIDSKKPIDAYWLLFAKDGRREELGTFDKKAYGYSAKPNGDGSYDLVLKAVKDRAIRVSIINGKAKGIIKINDKDAYIQKVYVNASGISVKYYTLTGLDVKTGAVLEEKVLND